MGKGLVTYNNIYFFKLSIPITGKIKHIYWIIETIIEHVITRKISTNP